MSAPLTGPKPLFPAPLPGQTMLFPALGHGHHHHRCEQSPGSLGRNGPHSRCSCDSSYAAPSGFSRLLPAISSEQPINPSNIQNEPWLRLSNSGSRFNYDSLLLNSFPLYGKFTGESYPSIDYALLANARRKNATRETTSTLKQWLNEHKKNPYPTKGEKVMLAILTKMTLTQVSTWFANARRRLKKENKMTWSPRKKSGDKKSDGKDDDSCASDSDLEAMDVDVDGEQEEFLSKVRDDGSVNDKTVSSAEVAAINIKRPSVIRTLESPTFNEIRDRFKGVPSPVNDLQKWVNGCFQGNSTEVSHEYPQELTPPSTPIESKVTTFTSQKLFEAFDAAKQGKHKENTPPPSLKDDISPLIIFSSKQPVLSTRETTTISTSVIENPKSFPVIPGIITPQPSPKNETEFFNPKLLTVKPDIKEAAPPAVETVEKLNPKVNEEPNTKTEKKPDPVRIQGLTTSRELEAVMALTNLFQS